MKIQINANLNYLCLFAKFCKIKFYKGLIKHHNYYINKTDLMQK